MSFPYTYFLKNIHSQSHPYALSCMYILSNHCIRMQQVVANKPTPIISELVYSLFVYYFVPVMPSLPVATFSNVVLPRLENASTPPIPEVSKYPPTNIIRPIISQLACPFPC